MSEENKTTGPFDSKRCGVCVLPPDGTISVVVHSRGYGTRILIQDEFYSSNHPNPKELMGGLVKDAIDQNEKAKKDEEDGK